MQKHLINVNDTLHQALDRLNQLSGEAMTLLAVNAEGNLVGTLTDGDMRRALLAGTPLSAPLSTAMNHQFTALTEPVDPTQIHEARRKGLRLLPVVDPNGTPLRIIDLRTQTTELPLRAMLMAGGRGERLRPLTDTCPKPLLAPGGTPIIDRNINALRCCGVKDISVSVRYLAHQLEAHFQGSVVKCIRETEPLGTLGACAQLPPHSPYATTLVMNSDLLTNISFEDMYLLHMEQGNDITIATIPHTVSIPFAILTTQGDQVTGIEEKPTYTHYANAGIYMMKSDLLASIPPHTRLDAPDFIEATLRSGGRVGHFPIRGYWLDIGTPADYRQAEALLKLT